MIVHPDRMRQPLAVIRLGARGSSVRPSSSVRGCPQASTTARNTSGQALMELPVNGVTDGQVGHVAPVAADLGIGVAVAGLFAFHHPDETRHPLAQGVDAVQRPHEFADTLVIGRRQQPRDIQLGQLKPRTTAWHGHFVDRSSEPTCVSLAISASPAVQ